MHKLKLVINPFFLLVVVILTSCNMVAEMNDTTSGTMPQETNLIKAYDLFQSNNSGSELSCNYGFQNYTSDKNVTRIIVYGLGERPERVEVSRDAEGTLADITAELPSITSGPTIDVTTGDGWTATGHGLDCSVFGCAGGQYNVLVGYPTSFSSCPSKLSIEVQVPPT